MERRRTWLCVLGGLAFGVLLTSAVWLCAVTRLSPGTAGAEETHLETAVTSPDAEQDKADMSQEPAEPDPVPSTPQAPSPGAWDSAAVYTGGDAVSYQGKQYRAKWWTQGEEPGRSDVWRIWAFWMANRSGRRERTAHP